MTEVTSVVIEQPAVVDVSRTPQQESIAARNKALEKMSMDEFAAHRNAEETARAKGLPIPKLDAPAEPAKKDEPAAATETKPDDATVVETTAAAEGDGEDDETDESASSEPEAGKKRNRGIEKKFGKLTKAVEQATEEARQAREAAEKLRLENEALMARLNTPPPSSVPAEKDDPAPDQSKFEDPDAFEAARNAHTARAEIRKAEETAAKAQAERAETAKKEATERQQKAVTEAIAALHKGFNERLEAAKVDLPDIETKVINNDKLALENVVFFGCEKLELGPQILYHLAEHPDEIPALNALKAQPFELAAKLGEYQAQIRAARKPQTTKAAAPIKPVTTGRGSAERVKDEDLSMEQFAAKRNAEEAEKRAAERGHRSNARH